MNENVRYENKIKKKNFESLNLKMKTSKKENLKKKIQKEKEKLTFENYFLNNINKMIHILKSISDKDLTSETMKIIRKLI